MPVAAPGAPYILSSVAAPALGEWSLQGSPLLVERFPGPVGLDRLPFCDAVRAVYAVALTVPVSCSGDGSPVTFAASGMSGPEILEAFTAAIRSSGGSVEFVAGAVVVNGPGEGEISGVAMPGLDLSGEQADGWLTEEVIARAAVDLVEARNVEPAAVMVRGLSRDDAASALSGIGGVDVVPVPDGAIFFGERARVELVRQIVEPAVPSLIEFQLGTGSVESVRALREVFPAAEIGIDEQSGRVWVRAAPDVLRQVVVSVAGLLDVPLGVQVEADIVDWRSDDGASASASIRGVASDRWSLGSSGALVLPVGDHTLAVNLARSVGQSAVIASPSAVVASGGEAELVAGDEVPVISETIDSNGIGRQSVSYRDTGVILRVSPVHRSDGTIEADIVLELVTASDTQPPVFRTRRVVSRVRVTSGTSVVLAGLSVSGDEYARSGFPGLSFAGLGGERGRASYEGELIAVVTLTAVRPDGL